MHIANRRVRALLGTALAATMLAACSSSSSSTSPGNSTASTPMSTGASSMPASTSGGAPVKLDVGTFGVFGYLEAKLWDKYHQLNPNVTVVEHKQEQEGDYWTALTAHLTTGTGLYDVQAIEVGRIAQVAGGPLGAKFIDLKSQGLDPTQWYDFKVKQATTPGGQIIGAGTDIGPEAMCYRNDLLKAAGLHTDRAMLKDDWSTWDKYIALGKQYQAKVGSSKPWVDSAAGIFRIYVGQSTTQYANPDGSPNYENSTVTGGWEVAAQLAESKLSAKLSQFGTDWNKAFSQPNGFATIACPAWMLGYIKTQAKDAFKGKWDVAIAPGGGGNWGGSFLAVPTASQHQADAAKLVLWLTAKDQEIAVFQAVGNFPSNKSAASDPAVANHTNDYFNNAPDGQLFSQAASQTGAAPVGKNDATIAQDITNGILQMEKGTDKTTAWNAVKTQIQKDIGG